MPVVTLYFDRLETLVGKKANKIIDALPFLGLDIEEQTPEYVRVEYSPNRPDYATDVGIAAGLKGLLGIKKGIDKLTFKKEKSFLIRTDPSVKKIRPYVSGIVAKNGKLDDEAIRQLIALQEDLHFGVGRRRKKASIGIHNLDAVSFPLRYTAVSKDHKFVPLANTQEMTAEQILAKTDVGSQYGKVLDGAAKLPMILDANGNTLSFPPIINSALTAVSTSTTNLLVEVTGTDKNAVDDTLSVVAMTLQNFGFTLFDLRTDVKSSAESLKTRTMALEPTLVHQTLGVSITNQAICNSIKKCRLDAVVRGKKIICTIPRFRFDILGPMDLIEEVALGYGIQNLKPTIPLSGAVGQKSELTKRLDRLGQIMVGLGFTEALNSSLTSSRILYEQTNRNPTGIIEVAESKSLEHTVLRDSILPGLLENLSRNIHESYPQKLFESGTVFSNANPIGESISLACISAHKDANYAEIKAVLQSLLKTDSGVECKTKTSTNPVFANGKTADILVGDKKIGVIGEIAAQVIDNFKIRVPVCGFEITLSELI
ncbi:MAG TPA: phenylalanine--tRNA ligase subunit beta [Candidatus Nitrosotenuis sp.]|nr:phenylalanine--tRNA ligase subunit beta [Candidatus Nitrosotenuis sp.]